MICDSAVSTSWRRDSALSSSGRSSSAAAIAWMGVGQFGPAGRRVAGQRGGREPAARVLEQILEAVLLGVLQQVRDEQHAHDDAQHRDHGQHGQGQRPPAAPHAARPGGAGRVGLAAAAAEARHAPLEREDGEGEAGGVGVAAGLEDRRGGRVEGVGGPAGGLRLQFAGAVLLVRQPVLDAARRAGRPGLLGVLRILGGLFFHGGAAASSAGGSLVVIGRRVLVVIGRRRRRPRRDRRRACPAPPRPPPFRLRRLVPLPAPPQRRPRHRPRCPRAPPPRPPRPRWGTPAGPAAAAAPPPVRPGGLVPGVGGTARARAAEQPRQAGEQPADGVAQRRALGEVVVFVVVFIVEAGRAGPGGRGVERGRRHRPRPRGRLLRDGRRLRLRIGRTHTAARRDDQRRHPRQPAQLGVQRRQDVLGRPIAQRADRLLADGARHVAADQQHPVAAAQPQVGELGRRGFGGAQRRGGRLGRGPPAQQPSLAAVVGEAGAHLHQEDVALVHDEAGEAVAGLVARQAGAVPVEQLLVPLADDALQHAGQGALALEEVLADAADEVADVGLAAGPVGLRQDVQRRRPAARVGPLGVRDLRRILAGEPVADMELGGPVLRSHAADTSRRPHGVSAYRAAIADARRPPAGAASL